MRRSKRVIEEIERYLFSAYRAQEDPLPPPGWADSVMADVRTLGSPETGTNGEAMFSRFAWRFALVAGVAALILLAFTYSNGFVDYQELAARYLANPIDFII